MSRPILGAMLRKAYLEGKSHDVLYDWYESTFSNLISDRSHLTINEQQSRAEVETWRHFWPNETFLSGTSIEESASALPVQSEVHSQNKRVAEQLQSPLSIVEPLAPPIECEVQNEITEELKPPPRSSLTHDTPTNPMEIQNSPPQRQMLSSSNTAIYSSPPPVSDVALNSVIPAPPTNTLSQHPCRHFSAGGICRAKGKCPDFHEPRIRNQASASRKESKRTAALQKERSCGNCYMKGHTLATCVAPVDKFGFISGCPKCNTKGHLFEYCPTQKGLKKHNRETLYLFLAKFRDNRPPIRWSQDFRDLPGFSKKSCRPWTHEFSLKQAGKFSVSYDKLGWSIDPVRDPAWDNPDTVSPQAYPDEQKVQEMDTEKETTPESSVPKHDVASELAELSNFYNQPSSALNPTIRSTTGKSSTRTNTEPKVGLSTEESPFRLMSTGGNRKPVEIRSPPIVESSTSTNIESSTSPSSLNEPPLPLHGHLEAVDPKSRVSSPFYANIAAIPAKVLPISKPPEESRNDRSISPEQEPWPSLYPSVEASNSKNSCDLAISYTSKSAQVIDTIKSPKKKESRKDHNISLEQNPWPSLYSPVDLSILQSRSSCDSRTSYAYKAAKDSGIWDNSIKMIGRDEPTPAVKKEDQATPESEPLEDDSKKPDIPLEQEFWPPLGALTGKSSSAGIDQKATASTSPNPEKSGRSHVSSVEWGPFLNKNNPTPQPERSKMIFKKTKNASLALQVQPSLVTSEELRDPDLEQPELKQPDLKQPDLKQPDLKQPEPQPKSQVYVIPQKKKAISNLDNELQSFGRDAILQKKKSVSTGDNESHSSKGYGIPQKKKSISNLDNGSSLPQKQKQKSLSISDIQTTPDGRMGAFIDPKATKPIKSPSMQQKPRMLRRSGERRSFDLPYPEKFALSDDDSDFGSRFSLDHMLKLPDDFELDFLDASDDGMVVLRSPHEFELSDDECEFRSAIQLDQNLIPPDDFELSSDSGTTDSSGYESSSDSVVFQLSTPNKTTKNGESGQDTIQKLPKKRRKKTILIQSSMKPERMGGGGSIVPFRAGDWKCKGCGCYNRANFLSCIRCNSRKLGDAIVVAFLGDWKCKYQECCYHNFARDVICSHCGPRSTRDDATAVAGFVGRWKCSTMACGFSNSPNSMLCGQCGVSCIDNVIFDPSSVDWKCLTEGCGYYNSVKNDNCLKCGERGDGAPIVKESTNTFLYPNSTRAR